MEFASKMRCGLVEQLGQEIFDLWFGDEVDFRVVSQRLQVLADTSFRLERLKKVYLNDIRTAAGRLGWEPSRLDFVVAAAGTESRKTINGSQASASNRKPRELPTETEAALPSRIAPPGPAPAVKETDNGCGHGAGKSQRWLRAGSQQRTRSFRSLDTFVVGDCNHLARTSADMVTRQMGEVSPLVVHGPTGVGKTHLLEGIWTLARQRERRARVLYLSAEQFTTYFLEALKGGGLPTFRRKYRHANLLLIDDVQFLAGKQATLIELTHTIDQLARDGGQLILTADRPPAELSSLGRELVARLSGGLVCGMKPLDQKTMEGVSQQWAVERRIVMDDGVHALVASRMRGDARQLSGVLNRLFATSVAMNAQITPRMAHEVIDELVPAETRVVRLQDIRRAVCEAFGLPGDSLAQASRNRAICRARTLAMWLSRKHTSSGSHEISAFFGRKSHSSAVAACQNVESWMRDGAQLELKDKNCDVHDVICRIEERLRAG